MYQTIGCIFYHPLSFLLFPLLISVSLGVTTGQEGKYLSLSNSPNLSTETPFTCSTLIHHLISVQYFMCLCMWVCTCGGRGGGPLEPEHTIVSIYCPPAFLKIECDHPLVKCSWSLAVISQHLIRFGEYHQSNYSASLNQVSFFVPVYVCFQKPWKPYSWRVSMSLATPTSLRGE